jgi:hypothetical protein
MVPGYKIDDGDAGDEFSGVLRLFAAPILRSADFGGADFAQRRFTDFSFCVGRCLSSAYDLDLARVSAVLGKSIHIELCRCVSWCVS